jgi:hypothetical protein
MAGFELQTPMQRMRFFNVKDYPGNTAVLSVVNGPSQSRFTATQSYQRNTYQTAINQGNYNYVENSKFFPLDQVPVDTEASMRKLDQGLLFRSQGPEYATRPYVQPRMFGGYEPLPFGFNYPDPQSVNPTRGRNPDIY